VAYRYFATDKRRFIVADAPGHEQYTRNMATAASTAELAIILVDAAKGTELLPQTQRHTVIASLLGIRHFVLAVNKMDLVEYDRAVFQALADKYREFAQKLGVSHVECIPISALRGDNMLGPSPRMPWYHGPALLPYLECVECGEDAADGRLRMPVQWVNRPDAGFRGFAGTIAEGKLSPGDRVKVLPSGTTAGIARVVTREGDLPLARRGQAVTLVLDRDLDVSRGDVICAADDPVAVADQFAVHLLWMSADEMMPGRSYLLKTATTMVPASITALKHKVNVSTLEHQAGRTLALNEIGVCNIALDKAIPFEPYAASRALGSFILIDRISLDTVGMGLIDFDLHRASNIHWQSLTVSRDARALQKRQSPCVVWFTGLSGAGKSTIATALDQRLYGLGLHTYVLDGDNVRHGLNRDLGFTEVDRVENIRRVGEVAALMADAGLIVLVSFISPFRSERRLARNLMKPGEFIEVFVDAPLAVCETRDPKGLYRKARRHEISNFTGIDSPYERPERADITLRTDNLSVKQAVDELMEHLRARGVMGRTGG
jgi:bifunctional enzyme CysN/CysC